MIAKHISVRSFVEFLLKSGDIDNRVRVSSEAAMREGTRLHKLIQKSRGARYHAEVPLSYTHDTGRYTLSIEGRADGVAEEGPVLADDAQLTFEIAQDGSVTGTEAPEIIRPVMAVEEIKCTYRNVQRMEEPVAVHLAQAKCYAHFLCEAEGLPAVRVCMTYCNLDSEEVRMFREDYTAEALKTWFDALLAEYLRWSDFRFDWEHTRTASIHETVFPFDYRRGQKDLAAAVYRTIVHGRKLFLEAPTGTGKTIATVFPAVKAIGEEKANRLFYLTARTVTRTAAEEAFRLMRARSGLRFKTVTITAKDKICANDVCDCNPDACPRAKGHFDRVNAAVFDLMTNEDVFDRKTVEAYAAKHGVCPFELSLDMSLFADGIICDYNYLFDPFVYLRRFFADGEDTDNLFLVDEAHNLVDRGREMYSAKVTEGDLYAARRVCETRRRLEPASRALDKAIDALSALGEPLHETKAAYRITGNISSFAEAISRVSRLVSEYLDDRTQGRGKAGEEIRRQLLELYLVLFRFRTVYEGFDERYRAYVTRADTLSLHLFCIDPSGDLARCMAKGRASVLFSATLLPVQYYKRLLGGAETDYEVYAESVFAPEHCVRVIVNDVTSRYTARGAELYRKIAKTIREVIRVRRGNYLVFFPSFEFLGEVLARYGGYAEESGERLLVQQADMTEEDRERFLGAFPKTDLSALPRLSGMRVTTEEDAGTTGFCVLGGIFSEGIDLPGEALIGVIVVGTGLPQVGTRTDILKAGFDDAGEDGFDYAYRFPGMNRVLQAAGRVIRTQEDKGVVVLLDVRFQETRNRSLFPREWGAVPAVSSEEVYDFLIKRCQSWNEPS